ncbi:MAG: IMP dehydrogenase [Chloroflexota bacterium]|jgi:IMP dehydrogenase
MNLRSDIGLTFDDVLLVPKKSAIRSRKDVSTATMLTRAVRLNIPILSANMDTVTEANMAIAMAQQGGLGILHRFMSIERQAEQVRRVKRAESLVVLNPLTISPQASVCQARQIMSAEDVGGLVVVDEVSRLVGLVTSRDVLLAPNADEAVETVMTPLERLVIAKAGESLESARQKLFQARVEKLPLVTEDGRLAGLITVQDIVKLQEHPDATKDNHGRLKVGVAVGVRREELDRAAACVDEGADVLVVDIAHGHSEHTRAMVTQLKKTFPTVALIAGNVATAEGVRELVDAGADAVKVGVGAGSICITRVVTGFGVPQLTTVADCAEEGHRLNIPIIADGGMRTSGDVTKALAAGASAVMLGSMLAGTEEAPGAEIIRQGRRYKVVRGMASLSANVERRKLDQPVTKEEEYSEELWSEVIPEGVEALVPYRGEVGDILHQLVGGVRSGMSYAGARTLVELWANAEFIRITPAGQKESGAHDVDLI